VGTWEKRRGRKSKGEIPPIELWRKQLAKLSTETEKMSLKRVGGFRVFFSPFIEGVVSMATCMEIRSWRNSGQIPS
jgi:hypothetical protein